MQVSFFAPALVPSAPAAAAAGGLSSTSAGDRTEAFASVLDSRSEGLPRPAGNEKRPLASGGAGTADSDEYDFVSGEPAEPETEEPVAEDDAADWKQRACAAVVDAPVVLPLPIPLPVDVPVIETAAQGGTDTEATDDPLSAPTKETPGTWVSLAAAASAPSPDAPMRGNRVPTAGQLPQPMADTSPNQGTTDSATPNGVPPEETPRVVVPAGAEAAARGNESGAPTGTVANVVREPRPASWRVIDRARAAGAEIIVRDAGEAAQAQATTNTTSPTAGMATPGTVTAAGLFGAAPTLAQMLVETVVSNTPRPPQHGATTGSETNAPTAANASAPNALTRERSVPPLPDTSAKQGMPDLATLPVVVPTVEASDQGDEIEAPTGTVANVVREPRPAPWRVIDRARAAGAEIIVRDAGEAAQAQATTNTTSPTAGMATPGTVTAAGLFGAAPTLAQMLVETVVSNTPRPPQLGATTGSETPTPIGATVPALPGEEVATASPQADSTFGNVGESAGATAGSAGETRTDSSVQGGREILASAGGKSARVTRTVAKGGDVQNFQAVEKQRVGKGAAEIGMHTAEKTQPMPTNATVLPPADAALEMFELPASPAQTTGAASATAAKPLADVGATRSFAAAAVREVMNAVERTQDTGHAHVELRLQTHDDESLRVHLQWRDGVVHAKFVTQTGEMQRALSSEWDAVAPRLAEKGLKFSEPSFERNGHQPEPQPGQSGFAFNQQQRRSANQSADADESPDFALPFAKATSAAGVSRRPASRTTTTNRIDLADARGLRVWA